MRKLKIGDKVKVLDNSSGANYAIGSVGVIVQITECSRTLVLEDVKTKIRGNWIQAHDVKLFELSEQEIQEEISSLNEQIKEKENMLKWMKETNNETFNEEEFKVWKTLTLFEDETLSKSEKAKLIAKLIS